MRTLNTFWMVLAVIMMAVNGARAEELLDEPVAVTVPADSSVAIATGPAVTPVLVGTGPAVVPVVAEVEEITVVVPADTDRKHDIVAWKRLRGTVQSVDRANRALTVQDRDGKDIQVAYNDQMQIYRRGEPVAYADVEPNDIVDLRYGDADRRDE